ncbi:OmpH family outer membrane protein [Winogradskyella thalassocola]|nr:OmpH family outer membrane protein [Winogradskyella thalassocola]
MKTKMMKFKVLFLLTIIGLVTCSVNAQRGVRIGYIDTEYILQNVPEYKEASSQLDKKVQQWKTEIETKLNAIEQKKKELDNESVLLTKELYDERYEDITFEEAEVLDYQQKRFGPEGDLMIQKRQLIEPIQDQIFAAVQEIAETKSYDFVFDKSADVVMLYSAERYDMSEQVLRTITRTSKRSQAKSKKERQELEDEEVVPVVSADKDERQQALEDRKASREEQLAAKREEREKAAEERKQAQQDLRDAKKKEAEERRQKVIDERNARSGSTSNEAKTVESDSTAKAKSIVKADSVKVQGTVKKDSVNSKMPKTAAEIAAEERAQKLKDREARQKELEARKQKIIDQRKKAREERERQVKKNDSIAKAKKNEDNN